MAKIDDVAKLAGVSPATVSRVMNGTSAVKASTRQKVEAALDQLSYRPSHAARALARTKDSYAILSIASTTKYLRKKRKKNKRKKIKRKKNKRKKNKRKNKRKKIKRKKNKRKKNKRKKRKKRKKNKKKRKRKRKKRK